YEEFGQDIAEIAELAQRIENKGLLHAVALDPYGIGAIVDALYDVGISGEDRIVGISKGWKLTGAIKTAERKLADKSLRHSGQGLMAWAVANARVEPKGNAIIITKQASGSAKIDPLMSAFNAIALMSTNPWVASGTDICDLRSAVSELRLRSGILPARYSGMPARCSPRSIRSMS